MTATQPVRVDPFAYEVEGVGVGRVRSGNVRGFRRLPVGFS